MFGVREVDGVDLELDWEVFELSLVLVLNEALAGGGADKRGIELETERLGREKRLLSLRE
jgi:hypothetical protein